jgi:hypothetical protein
MRPVSLVAGWATAGMDFMSNSPGQKELSSRTLAPLSHEPMAVMQNAITAGHLT